MTIRPYEMSDSIRIKSANGAGLEKWGLKNGLVDAFLGMQRSGTFWTLLDGEEIVIIGGYYQAFDGVVEAALFPSERFIRSPKGALVVVKQYLDDWKTKFRRIQMTCREEDSFVRFAEWLGFEKEGILRNFGTAGHHVMMSIVR